MKQLTIFNSENAERETGFYYLCARFNTLTVTLTPDSMKTTQATVNLVLNEQRKNKDGLCPVVLRIFWKGRKDRQTGIYIPKSQWLVKEQCVKPTHPQSGTLNLRLQEIKLEKKASPKKNESATLSQRHRLFFNTHYIR